LLLLIASATSVAFAYEPPIDLLAGSYRFGEINTRGEGCLVVLKRSPVSNSERELRPIEIASACRAKVAALGNVTHWAAIGGASIALYGGDPLRELSDFSPVQDGTGVYLRGGFSGDAKVYELRALSE
jgi:hypothetical protein